MSQLFNLCSDCGDLPLRDRLNYLLGQVLGVSEFQQEQTYFLHKSRLHNRSLHGYGTVWGLAVSHDGTGDDLRLQVAPGLAIDAQGQEIWVDALQCAALNTWLNAPVTEGSTTLNRETLQPLTAGGSVLALYVTLGYRTCKTGLQPILGDPCRADLVAGDKQGVLQYTRLRDDFQLNLQALPPRYHEEARIRAIGELWAAIEIDPVAPALSDSDRTALVQTLRDAIDDPTLIAGLGVVILPQVQARDLLRELFNHWISITRPNLDRLSHPIVQLLTKIATDPNPAAIPLDTAAFDAQMQIFSDAYASYVTTQTLDAIAALPIVTVAPTTATALRRAVLQLGSSQPLTTETTEDKTVLLAEVRFELTAANSVDEATLTIENLLRPTLVQTRLLQELLLQGASRTSAPAPGLVLHPTDLVLSSLPDQIPVGLLPADPPLAVVGSIASYPALLFSPGGDGTTTGLAAFSTLVPIRLRPESPPILRLYCMASSVVSVTWTVAWRWRRSLAFDGAPQPEATLTADGFNITVFAPQTLQSLQLQQSRPLALAVEVAAAAADYLQVYLMPIVTSEGGGAQPFYLLSANLRWAS